MGSSVDSPAQRYAGLAQCKALATLVLSYNRIGVAGARALVAGAANAHPSAVAPALPQQALMQQSPVMMQHTQMMQMQQHQAMMQQHIMMQQQMMMLGGGLAVLAVVAASAVAVAVVARRSQRSSRPPLASICKGRWKRPAGRQSRLG